MHYPLAFIENQMAPISTMRLTTPGRVLKLSKSTLVKDWSWLVSIGYPTAIQAFIPAHHGTMLIAYSITKLISGS